MTTRDRDHWMELDTGPGSGDGDDMPRSRAARAEMQHALSGIVARRVSKDSEKFNESARQSGGQ